MSKQITETFSIEYLSNPIISIEKTQLYKEINEMYSIIWCLLNLDQTKKQSIDLRKFIKFMKDSQYYKMSCLSTQQFYKVYYHKLDLEWLTSHSLDTQFIRQSIPTYKHLDGNETIELFKKIYECIAYLKSKLNDGQLVKKYIFVGQIPPRIFSILKTYPEMNDEQQVVLNKYFGQYWRVFWELDVSYESITFVPQDIPFNCTYSIFQNICIEVSDNTVNSELYCWCRSNPTSYLETLIKQTLFRLLFTKPDLKQTLFPDLTDRIEMTNTKTFLFQLSRLENLYHKIQSQPDSQMDQINVLDF